MRVALGLRAAGYPHSSTASAVPPMQTQSFIRFRVCKPTRKRGDGLDDRSVNGLSRGAWSGVRTNPISHVTEQMDTPLMVGCRRSRNSKQGSPVKQVERKSAQSKSGRGFG